MEDFYDLKKRWERAYSEFDSEIDNLEEQISQFCEEIEKLESQIEDLKDGTK